jgi:hypothetical protein
VDPAAASNEIFAITLEVNVSRTWVLTKAAMPNLMHFEGVLCQGPGWIIDLATICLCRMSGKCSPAVVGAVGANVDTRN